MLRLAIANLEHGKISEDKRDLTAASNPAAMHEVGGDRASWLMHVRQPAWRASQQTG